MNSASPSIEEWRTRWTSCFRSSAWSSSSASQVLRSVSVQTAPIHAVFPITDASWMKAFWLAGQRVKAGGDDALDRLGQVIDLAGQRPPAIALDQQAAVLQHPHVLLGIQRIAFRAVEQRLLHLGG